MAKNKPTLRSRYSKASIAIRKQLKRAEGRPGYKAMVQKYRGEFPTLEKLGDISDRDLRLLTARAEQLLETKALGKSHESQINRALDTFQSRGYDYLNRSNIDDFFDFLDDARARGLTSIYGYEAILDAVNRARKRGLSDEEIIGNIQHWTEYNTGQRLYVRRGRKPRSSSDDF